MASKTTLGVSRLVAGAVCVAAVLSTGTLEAQSGDGAQRDRSELVQVQVPDSQEIPARFYEPDAFGEVELGRNVHVLPWQDPNQASQTKGSPGFGVEAAPSRKTLTYYGGPVISNVNVVKVNYGSGTYQSYVSGTGSGTMSAFFKGITGSPYFSWLNGDYKTSTQTIGYGSFAGDFPIAPSSARNGATISDTQVQSELVAQIAAGTLPAPSANSLYFVYFPKGKKITQGTSSSCVSGGFCAYHGTIKSSTTPGGYIYYAVMPDNSSGSGCDVGCGSSTPFNNWCSVSSHEMIEAVTDPAVGVAATYASPLAWYNKTYGEIGDICNGQQGSVVGTDGVTYTVQLEWSNSKTACRAQ
jgi:hypothetical protein